ncbi:MAG: hypothetical protein AAFO88_03415 [Pseudomonadota bacterium]
MDRLSPFLLLGVGVVAGIAATLAWTHQGTQQLTTDTPETAYFEDGRTPIAFTTEEREHIRSEMLAFLQGAQSISYGLAEQDRRLIGEAARELSPGAGDPIGASIRAKAPEGFVSLSRGLRRDFGELAVLSEFADFPDLQLHFSATVSRCVACHGTYRSQRD